MDQTQQNNFSLVLHDDGAMGTFQPHNPNNIYNPEQAAYYNYYVPQEHISNMQAPTGKQHAPVGPAPHVNNGSASKRPLRPQPSSSSSVVPVSAPSAASSHVRTLPVTATGTGTSRATVPAPVANNQSAFINKLYTMLEEADQHLISWDETGTFFIVKNTTDFSKAVLPLYFKHNNFASFVRQLNMYGFHKINDSFFKLNNVCSEVWEFKHHDFRRGEYHLLVNIKRKAPKANGTGGGGNKGGGHSNGRGMYNKEAHLPNSVIGAGSSVSSSPMCNMITPNMQVNAGGYADLSMLGGGYSGMGGGEERVDELQSRVYELESKLATLSESYELVCNETLNCRRELSTYNNVITHMVTLIATMAQKMPGGSGSGDLERQLSKLAQVTLEATEFSSMTSGPPTVSDSLSSTSGSCGPHPVQGLTQKQKYGQPPLQPPQNQQRQNTGMVMSMNINTGAATLNAFPGTVLKVDPLMVQKRAPSRRRSALSLSLNEAEGGDRNEDAEVEEGEDEGRVTQQQGARGKRRLSSEEQDDLDYNDELEEDEAVVTSVPSSRRTSLRDVDASASLLGKRRSTGGSSVTGQPATKRADIKKGKVVAVMAAQTLLTPPIGNPNDSSRVAVGKEVKRSARK